MKKRILSTIIILFLTYIAFADSSMKNAMTKDAVNRELSFLASDESYSLYQDNSGKLYLYNENWLFDEIYLYKEDGESSKDKVQSKMTNADDVSKVINSNYTVYRVDMGLFEPTYFYVKTPKGNFYSVSEKIKTINVSASKIIDEL